MQAIPYYLEIPYLDPVEVFDKLHGQSWALFFDSATHHEGMYSSTDRYSYILCEPFKTVCIKNKIHLETAEAVTNPLAMLQQEMHDYHCLPVEELPPFQGGIAGYFGYDLCHYLEDIPYPSIDDMAFPDLAVGFYDSLISFDHQLKKSWVVSTGFPTKDSAKRELNAKKKIAELIQLINTAEAPYFEHSQELNPATEPQSNFTRTSYLAAVEQARNFILEGDVFEVNLSQRFKTKLPDKRTPYALYKKLRRTNPAPFSAFMNLGDTILASASPERFISLHARCVETRPIKGTARRGQTPSEDRALRESLQNSQKDQAENVMIVDLMRNDLSKVCEPHSVHVDALCRLETYASVHHLVSVIKAELKNGYDAFDVLQATFPGGSITGAPKIRAMELIAKLEPNRRGPYCGSAGFISFHGDMDTSILIRTYAIKNDTITYQAGGAVILDSVPELEYEETLHKAYALTQALR
jgi:para-aminobenzoate synthetase component 1